MKIIFAMICVFLSSSAFSGTVTGTVDYIVVRASDGIIYFTINGSLVNRPPCATKEYWMIKDENSNAGKQQYSMILSAQASGKTVYVLGMNTCTRWGDGEDVDHIQIYN